MEFLAHYQKDMTDKVSSMQRFSVFKGKVREIIEFNKDKTQTWEKGINRWSDLSETEFYEEFPLLKGD